MRLTIYGVGDMMLGEQELCSGFGIRSLARKYGYSYIFENIHNIFNDGDLVFGNLEGAISDSVTNNKNIYFYGDSNAMNLLKEENFTVLSVTNNHILQHGTKTYKNTVSYLKANSILPAGDKETSPLVEIKGIKIAVLSYSFADDKISEHPYNYVTSDEPIIKAITQLRTSCDIIIVSLHWGAEHVPYPSLEQIQIARRIIDSGADIIFGHHAHVIQGYEIYNRKPIVYGFGNFIFDATYLSPTCKTFVAEIIYDSETKQFIFKTKPIYCNKKTYQPKLAEGKELNEICDQLNRIRNSIENKSICDIKKWLDTEEAEVKYKKEYRKQMYKHYIKNFVRYPLNINMSMINSYISSVIKK